MSICTCCSGAGVRRISEDGADDRMDPVPAKPDLFAIGDKVRKVDRDYPLHGVVVAVFITLCGRIRYVVEDDRGALFIHSDRTIVAR